MATYNTAMGVLPSPKTQIFGGNAGNAELETPKARPSSESTFFGGPMAYTQQEAPSPAPGPQAQPQAQPQAAAPRPAPPTQTFAQMQQQGQARPAPPLQQPMAPYQGGMFASLFGGGAGFGRPTIQDRIMQQSAMATPESVALAVVQQERGGRQAVMPGMTAQAGTVVTGEGGRLMVAGPGGLRPYDEAAREEEVLGLVGRGEVPGTPEYEIRQQLMQDSRVLDSLRGMFSLADQRAAAAQQQRAPSAADQFQQELIAQLRQFGGDGGGYESPAARQMREAKRAELEAKFSGEAAALNEEMARRGIFASSIAGGRLGDLGGQQARAIASMEAEMAMEAQKQAQENRRFFLQQMGELSQQMTTGELERSKLTLQERQVDADIDYRAKELQQEAMLKGRELDLQSARDLATKEYQSGQLQLGYAEMGSREKISGQELSAREQMQQQELAARQQMSAAEIASREKMSMQEFDLRRLLQQEQFGFQRGESALERAARAEEAKLERGLREAMQTRELTAAEKRQLTDIEANKQRQFEQQIFQAAQSQLERELRTKMQTTELSAAEKRQLAEIEANKAQQERQFGFTAEQSKLERNLREAMQTRELSAAEKRQLMEIEANKAQQERQFGFQRGESQLERDLRLAMQGTDIAARTKQMEAEQKFQAEQSKLERSLRETMQTRDLTAAEKRQLADIEANKAQQERQFGFQRGESALDRALRERFGMAEATGIMYGPDGKPVLDASGKPVQTLAGQQFGLSQRQFEASQKAQENQFMIQLAAALAPMDAAKRDEFLRNNPVIRSLLGMQSFGSVAGGTGAGIPRGTGGSGGGFGMDTGI